MADFLAGLSQESGVPAFAPGQRLVSDPDFTHWVVVEGHVIGEAQKVNPHRNGTRSAYVRLFDGPERAEYGTIDGDHLREKAAGLTDDAAAADRCTGEVQP